MGSSMMTVVIRIVINTLMRVVGMPLIDIMIVKALLLPLMSMITKVT